VRIRAALVQPYFTQLLAVAKHFGLGRLRDEWRVLDEEGTREARRAKPEVERILANLERGRELASASH